MPKLIYSGGEHCDPRWPPVSHEEADEEQVGLKLLSGCYILDDVDEVPARRGRARLARVELREPA